jgi:hypothetical protein
MWHNPGGGFGLATSPIPLGDVLEEADLAFILEGDPLLATLVGGSVTGMRPRLVVCRNLTTQQHIIIADGAPMWDCDAAGVGVTPGNIIHLVVTGTAN